MKKLIWLLACFSPAVFAIKNLGFLFKNEPINPACVAMFNASFADSPYINAINVDECQHSNAAYQKTLVKAKQYC